MALTSPQFETMLKAIEDTMGDSPERTVLVDALRDLVSKEPAADYVARVNAKAQADLEQPLKGGNRRAGFYLPSEIRENLLTAREFGFGGRPMSTGFSSLDEFFQVLPGQVTVITGIPNHGKSDWLDCVLLNLIRDHLAKCLIVSLENQPIELHLAKFAEKYSGKPFFTRNPETKIKDEDINAFCMIEDRNLALWHPDPDRPNTLDFILSESLKFFDEKQPSVLVIDPWNEIEHVLTREEFRLSETQLISRQLSKIRKFATGHQVHVFIVAHPTKLQKKDDGTYPVPTLYDISGSAHWRNKVDNGICIYRHEEQKEPDGTNPATAYIQKVRFRHCGRKGEAGFKYNFSTGVFTESESAEERKERERKDLI